MNVVTSHNTSIFVQMLSAVHILAIWSELKGFKGRFISSILRFRKFFGFFLKLDVEALLRCHAFGGQSWCCFYIYFNSCVFCPWKCQTCSRPFFHKYSPTLLNAFRQLPHNWSSCFELICLAYFNIVLHLMPTFGILGIFTSLHFPWEPFAPTWLKNFKFWFHE